MNHQDYGKVYFKNVNPQITKNEEVKKGANRFKTNILSQIRNYDCKEASKKNIGEFLAN